MNCLKCCGMINQLPEGKTYICSNCGRLYSEKEIRDIKDAEMIEQDMEVWRKAKGWDNTENSPSTTCINNIPKTIYAVGRIGRNEVQTFYYKYFEHKEYAERELRLIASSYCKENVKWNKYGGFHALNDYWSITELLLN